ncbi:hypothetical protein AWJ20_1044 [Sugiyamaella lignohabitans]|uniref:Uncharacterized protein n=1 Tax=Sugiyamaella lignohabitans TaxID=796027 RepID=A0A167DCX8_9ASCO|nr:uncharacterized protein AWJ20_1044 [Sugiyamaella lignohabitans]ANB12774.1 hypothetical protein AWJ20_1044 [Sugiyamaella lignohabitans]
MAPPVSPFAAFLDLSDIFKHFNSDLTSTDTHVSESGFKVFEITNSIDGYSSKEIHLGKPHLLTRHLSFVRESAFWLAPRTGDSELSLDRLGVLTIFERSDGVHVGILPSSGTVDLCTSNLKTSGGGSLVLRTENDSPDTQTLGQRVFVTSGIEFEPVVQALFDVARQVAFREDGDGDDDGDDGDNNENLQIDNKVLQKMESLNIKLGPTWKTEWYDGLMYCTWNGLGPVLSHDLIINALADLDASGVNISGIIIDDGWQHTNQYRQLYDLRADEFRFPSGLKGLVKDIRSKFPYIVDIGVWSTLVGYWEGVVPGSELDESYKTVDARMKNGKTYRLVAAEDTAKFYDDYFSSLAEAGITCVKIDYQAVIDDIQDHHIRGALYPAYQKALFDSSLKYFDGKVIYCMAMVPNIMLRSLQKRTVGSKPRPTPVLRNSNDFFPTILASHFWHIYCNLYNTTYTGNLYSIPDFDMFQSKLQAGGEEPLATRVTGLHAAARCISGGPIYFTDSPKKHELDLINAFSSPSRFNQRVVLRPSGIAKPVFPYLPFDADEGKTLHWGYNYSDLYERSRDGKATSIYSILLAAFNLCYDEVTQGLNWTTLLAVVNSGIQKVATKADYLVIRSYKTGKIWLPKDKTAEVSLLSGEWDMITAAPLIPVPAKPAYGKLRKDDDWIDISRDDSPAIAFFGLLDNICGVAGIHSYEITAKTSDGEGDLGINLWLKALGVIGLYATFPVEHASVSIGGEPLDKSRITLGKLLEFDIRYEAVEQAGSRGDELVLIEITLS